MKRFLTAILFFTGTLTLAQSPDFSSPEGVVNTFYSAVQSRNVELLSQCIHPESTHREALQYYARNTSEQQIKSYEDRIGEFGYIDRVTPPNEDSEKQWTKVEIVFYKTGGESHTVRVYVTEHDMGYRIISF